MSSVPDWLTKAEPPVPEEFAARLELAPATGPDPDRLVSAAEESLERALEPDGRERRGAFDMLAADGFLTYACEEALEADDPAPVLAAMVRRIGRSFR